MVLFIGRSNHGVSRPLMLCWSRPVRRRLPPCSPTAASTVPTLWCKCGMLPARRLPTATIPWRTAVYPTPFGSEGELSAYPGGPEDG